MLEDIITKILLGFSLAAPIGPVNVEMIKRGLAAGFWSAFNVRLGGGCANLSMLLLAYFGLAKINQYPRIVAIIATIGSLILIYLGIKNIINSFDKDCLTFLHSSISDHNKIKKYSIMSGLMIGFGLAISSPLGMMFWLSTFATSMQSDPNSLLKINPLFLNLFIILGVLAWGAGISLILHFFSKYINKKNLQLITALSGLMLLYFGIKYGMFAFNKIILLNQ